MKMLDRLISDCENIKEMKVIIHKVPNKKNVIIVLSFLIHALYVSSVLIEQSLGGFPASLACVAGVERGRG